MKSIDSVRRAVASIATSLRLTVLAFAAAIRSGRTSDLAALLEEGSPLELLAKGLLSAAFWVLALAPLLLVPAYYLLVSLT